VPFTALIADDEPLARADIRARLSAQPEIEVVGEAGDGPSVVGAIRTLKPDLVFLDVQMPGYDGLEALKRVGQEHLPLVVFVTAYDRYAVKAFELHALDYLLKPVSDQRFHQTLARAMQELGDESALNRRQLNLVEALYAARDSHLTPPAPYISRIAVKDKRRYVILKIADVDWIQSAANYVELHAGTRTLLLRTTLTSLEERLDPAVFVRIHRTSVVNLERVTEIVPSEHGDSLVRLQDGTSLPLSRKHRDRVLSCMDPGGASSGP
jgi:two-component system, LytTR family, response regulator